MADLDAELDALSTYALTDAELAHSLLDSVPPRWRGILLGVHAYVRDNSANGDACTSIDVWGALGAGARGQCRPHAKRH